jgi:AraC-like DNA-binding protein
MRSRFTWPRSCLPEIVIAGRFPFSPAGMAREYRHPTFALHLHHYHGRLFFGRRVFELRPGDMTLTPPGCVSHYELAEEGFHWCIHFRPVEMPSGTAAFVLPWRLPRAGGGREADFMRGITALFGSGKSRAERDLAASAAGAMLQALLLQLAVARTGTPPPQAETRAGRLLEIIREEIERSFRRPLCIADLARAAGLSRNYFSARFRARFQRTPQEYLRHCRMEAARALLISTDLAVKEIGFECGLPDPQHFNKQFRQAEGISPSAYRRRHEEAAGAKKTMDVLSLKKW